MYFRLNFSATKEVKPWYTVYKSKLNSISFITSSYFLILPQKVNQADICTHCFFFFIIKPWTFSNRFTVINSKWPLNLWWRAWIHVIVLVLKLPFWNQNQSTHFIYIYFHLCQLCIVCVNVTYSTRWWWTYL